MGHHCQCHQHNRGRHYNHLRFTQMVQFVAALVMGLIVVIKVIVVIITIILTSLR